MSETKTKAMRILIVNGPNLNMLGYREPSIYGTETMEDVLHMLRMRHPDVDIEYFQSNHEGAMIDQLQACAFSNTRATQGYDGVVLNAGGYTHTSIALRDAVALVRVPVVEVHISDITQREAFRKVSLLTDVCTHTIMGLGTACYEAAVEWLLHRENK